MAANRPASLRVIDSTTSTTYDFPFSIKDGAREYHWDIHSHQVGSDVRLQPNRTYPFRSRLFPLTGGLNADRLSANPDTYAKANGDASYPNLFVPPPKHTSITLTNGNSPFLILEFNSLLFIIGGRYVYTIDPTAHTANLDKDLGVGKAATWADVYQNELIVSMGESEHQWKRNTAGTWAQSADVFSIATGLVDSKFWRAASTNKLNNCITGPNTLANYVPASPNEYTVGDTTCSVNCIIDYQGGVWVGKADGMYAADPTGVFHNQTPQLHAWQHADNCKGSFVAQGSLWVPSAAGLLQVTQGASIDNGPEIVARPDYRFWVRGGVEHSGNIYLLCTDQAASEETVILKMVRVAKNQYVYHEWCRLGDTTKGYAIAITTVSTVPEMYVTHGNNAEYVSLALGGGRDIDDTLHVYGTASVLETGRISPSGGEGSLAPVDLGLEFLLEGVEVVCKLRTGDSITAAYRIDNQSYTNLLDNAESGSGVAAITGPTTDYQSVIRYAPANTSGQFLEVKLTCVNAAGSGTNRPEIIDAYAFGYLRPKPTNLLLTTLVLDGTTWSGQGTSGQLSAMDAHTLIDHWQNEAIELELQLEDYQENKTTRFIVTYNALKEDDANPGNASMLKPQYKFDVYWNRTFHSPDYGVS